ncbi:hypothetical protein [Actinomadura sp. BRA 177]|uniref:hypothetical protein n=1 Tax=Actinomadura sp. BRA 177 TaxID=2745202 RepID=UPI0015952A3F|nr:hypothetical protein [Actinomadura sp. BRA 177]NVI90854.1 hypothetical protein [Actinomadura sp. BRA 177]
MTTTSRRPPVRAPKKKRTAAPAAGPATAVKTAPKTPAKTPAKAPVKAPAKTPAAKPAVKKDAAVKKARSTTAAAVRARQAAGRRAAPRAPFVLLIIGLLGGALVSLLLLNTVLAKDAFTLTRLQQGNKQLEQQRQALEEENAREGSPASLGKKAEALGMKKAKDPAFFYTETGRASGGAIRPVPHAAAASAGAAGVVGVPGTAARSYTHLSLPPKRVG